MTITNLYYNKYDYHKYVKISTNKRSCESLRLEASKYANPPVREICQVKYVMYNIITFSVFLLHIFKLAE